jgi:hypothetical protein
MRNFPAAAIGLAVFLAGPTLAQAASETAKMTGQDQTQNQTQSEPGKMNAQGSWLLGHRGRSRRIRHVGEWQRSRHPRNIVQTAIMTPPQTWASLLGAAGPSHSGRLSAFAEPHISA